MNPDHKLQRLVIEALDSNPDLDCTHIGVTARDRIVTISGHVASNAEKRTAEIVAGQVAGVKAVIDNVLVELPGRCQTEDEVIAERCYERLAEDATLPLDRIHLSVKDGGVVIHGDVDHQFECDTVERQIAALACVRSVLNELTVKPPVKVEVVREKVRRSVSTVSPINADKIEVRAVGTRVTLKGTVNSWHEKGLAESAVWSVPGVSSIDDQLVVVS